MIPSGAGKSKATSALFAGLNVERLVDAPFAKYVGNKMNVFGSWRLETKGKEANKEYEYKVVSVDEHQILSGGVPETKGNPYRV